MFWGRIVLGQWEGETVTQRPALNLIGLPLVTTLKETFEQGSVKQLQATFESRLSEIAGRVGEALYLVQLYPMDREFNEVAPYTVIVAAQVADAGQAVPQGMIAHTLPAGEYVTVAYDAVYGHWMREAQRQPAGFDYEIWDHRYQPESPENEIELYVALR